MYRLKLGVIVTAIGIFLLGATATRMGIDHAAALSSGPPAGFTGADDENSCIACHSDLEHTGTFSVIRPGRYTPGATYTLQVRHSTADPTRKRWGFEMTALAGSNPAGTFSDTSTNTQVISGNGRTYAEHTSAGTFPNTTGGATWTVNWTAPATDVGRVTFWAAGNQADNDSSSVGDQIYLTSSSLSTRSALFDYDGDGKTDISVYRPSNNAWYLNRSTAGFTAYGFGQAGDVLAPADYTGDGKTDVAIFRPSNGTWFVLRSEDLTFYGAPFGTSGDLIAPGDYDGDGKADLAVFRPGSPQGTFYIQQSTAGFKAVGFGSAEDKPVAGDYDGDGKTDIALFRPSNRGWYRYNSSDNSFVAIQFGLDGDKVVPGDYTGDGKTDIAVWRESSGIWFVLRSEDLTFYGAPFGTTGDIPTSGDYDGDGKTDLAIYRSSQGTFYVQATTQGFFAQQFGLNGDVPTPNSYVY